MDNLIQKMFFWIIKINNFQGALTDVSAKKEELVTHRDTELSRSPQERNSKGLPQAELAWGGWERQPCTEIHNPCTSDHRWRGMSADYLMTDKYSNKKPVSALI